MVEVIKQALMVEMVVHLQAAAVVVQIQTPMTDKEQVETVVVE